VRRTALDPNRPWATCTSCDVTSSVPGWATQRVPLFQAIKARPYGRGEAQLNGERLHRTNAWAMVRRRAKAAGLTTEVCNHTFRGTGITAYLENGGTLEKARQMAAHASTRTTQLYDRREDRVTLDEVVKINIRG
jgi:integrase/recombinase XerD